MVSHFGFFAQTLCPTASTIIRRGVGSAPESARIEEMRATINRALQIIRRSTLFTTEIAGGPRGGQLGAYQGSLYLSNWHDFNGVVEYTDFAALPPAGDPYKPLPYVKEPLGHRGRGIRGSCI